MHTNPTATETFGTYLKRKRFSLAATRGHRVTQSEMVEHIKTLADNPLLAISAGTLYCWEADKRNPPMKVQKAIKSVLGE